MGVVNGPELLAVYSIWAACSRSILLYNCDAELFASVRAIMLK